VKLKIHQTCTSCPAALVCRAADVHYSSVCPRCKKPWLVLFHRNAACVYVVIFPPTMKCDDASLDWKQERDCLSCGGGKLRWAEFENIQTHLLDVS
jgi:hypothetical protein